MTGENDGSRFDRLPAAETEREVPDRPTRSSVLTFLEGRYGIPSETFEEYTFWEKGAGKIWAFAGTVGTPRRVEALGLHLLRTNQRDWKPTTDAVQRFGRDATRNVLHLDRERAAVFWRGETQAIDREDVGGYVIVTRPIAGDRAPLGVGLLTGGALRSQVPKGRRRDLDPS